MLLQGSAEAVCASLEALGSEIVTVKGVPVGLGPLSTADVEMAVSMGAHIIGFNVKASNAAVDAQAKQRGVPILRHNVIYHLLEEVWPAMCICCPSFYTSLESLSRNQHFRVLGWVP